MKKRTMRSRAAMTGMAKSIIVGLRGTSRLISHIKHLRSRFSHARLLRKNSRSGNFPRQSEGNAIMKLPQALAGAMALTIFGALAPPAGPAQAQTYDPKYPVCLQIYDDMVHFYFECGYTSMAQCEASASGRSAQCVVNPYYAGPKAKRAPRKKRPT
jgi:hypothetical protein